MKFSTTGLIVRKQNIGEQDRLVTVLTKSHGIVRAFVRRAENIKSPKCASTGLLCYSKLLISENKSGTYSIEEALSVEQFVGLRKNIENMSLAQYFCELSLVLCPKEAPADEFLRLILNALYLLSSEKKNPLLVKACVEMRFMGLCGYMPDLVMCGDCGTYQDEEMIFVPKTGKLFCKKCGDMKTDTVPKYELILGDCDLDRALSAKDSFRMKQFIIREEEPSEEASLTLDVNGDGRFTSRDLSALKRMIVS